MKPSLLLNTICSEPGSALNPAPHLPLRLTPPSCLSVFCFPSSCGVSVFLLSLISWVWFNNSSAEIHSGSLPALSLLPESRSWLRPLHRDPASAVFHTICSSSSSQCQTGRKTLFLSKWKGFLLQAAPHGDFHTLRGGATPALLLAALGRWPGWHTLPVPPHRLLPPYLPLAALLITFINSSSLPHLLHTPVDSNNSTQMFPLNLLILLPKPAKQFSLRHCRPRCSNATPPHCSSPLHTYRLVLLPSNSLQCQRTEGHGSVMTPHADWSPTGKLGDVKYRF